MDEIGQEPKREFRVPSGPWRWLAFVGVAGLVAAVTMVGVTRAGEGHGGHAASSPAATASHGLEPIIEVSAAVTQGSVVLQPLNPAPTAPHPAPGTVLLTCDSVVWDQMDPSWEADSLRVGTLWLLGGRHLGYVRLGLARQTAVASAGHSGSSRDVEMLVHVDAGSTVVIRAAQGTSTYFDFLKRAGTTGDFQGLGRGRGYTFVPCAAPDLGYGGLISVYNVGFSIVRGRTASVEVLTSPSARPVWLTFTAPSGEGGGPAAG
jgi:hypothetical protein